MVLANGIACRGVVGEAAVLDQGVANEDKAAFG